MSESTKIAIAVFLSSAWVLWCVRLYARNVQKKRNQTQVNHGADILVAYASQSGSAQALAIKKANTLAAKGKVNLLPLDRVCRNTLNITQQAHFVVSTYGQGEPPDNGQRFYKDISTSKSKSSIELSHLRYSVTALGDSSYEHFCAFGHNLHQRLATLGAQSQAEVVEIDSQVADNQEVVHDQNAGNEVNHQANWQLIERECLNPNSASAPLYLLSFSIEQGDDKTQPSWRAGDVIAIQPKHSQQTVDAWLQAHQLDGEKVIVKSGISKRLKQHLQSYVLPELAPVAGFNQETWLNALSLLPKREYSIASAKHESQLKLIVRLQHQANGQLGLGSGWLTEHSQLGDITQGVIRSNTRCHINDVSRPLLLIGAGSGLAGLRAQLAERAVHPKAGPVWMFYGERSPQDDAMLQKELVQWQKQGVIEHLHLAYSQDPYKPKYVQDLMQQYLVQIKAFVEREQGQNADIYICGNKAGMGDSVHQLLNQHLGQDKVSALLASGRYRRDLY